MSGVLLREALQASRCEYRVGHPNSWGRHGDPCYLQVPPVLLFKQEENKELQVPEENCENTENQTVLGRLNERLYKKCIYKNIQKMFSAKIMIWRLISRY